MSDAAEIHRQAHDAARAIKAAGDGLPLETIAAIITRAYQPAVDALHEAHRVLNVNFASPTDEPGRRALGCCNMIVGAIYRRALLANPDTPFVYGGELADDLPKGGGDE